MTQEISTKRFFDGLYSPPIWNIDNGLSPIAVPEGAGIYEDHNKKLIVFPIAGYTKPVNRHHKHDIIAIDQILTQYENTNRQNIIYDLAKATMVTIPSRNAIAKLVPNVTVTLVQEPGNPYDFGALLVMVQTLDKKIYPIGYIPSKINKIMTEKSSWYKQENFVLVIRMDEKNHLVPQIMVVYEPPSDLKNRFLNLQYE